MYWIPIQLSFYHIYLYYLLRKYQSTRNECFVMLIELQEFLLAIFEHLQFFVKGINPSDLLNE